MTKLGKVSVETKSNKEISSEPTVGQREPL